MPNFSSFIGEYIAIILISAFALMLVTNMLNMRMTSQGVSHKGKRRIIAEVWITFAVIISVFCYASRVIPHRLTTSPEKDIFADFNMLATLPADKLIMVIVTTIIALLAFIRLIITIRKVDTGEIIEKESTDDNNIEK